MLVSGCLAVALSASAIARALRWIGRRAHRMGVPKVGPAVARERSPEPPEAPLAYSTTTRRILSALLAWHVLALVVVAIPASPHTDGLRRPLRWLVVPWLQATRTQQSWGMWAPSPRVDNPMLQVLITDAEGRAWDMQTDLYAAARRSSASIVAYDRFRKMAGRMIQSGPDGPYQRAYASWHCRQWARSHDGRAPQQVELRELSYRIPTPEQVRDHGPYVPAEQLARTGSQRSLLTLTCE